MIIEDHELMTDPDDLAAFPANKSLAFFLGDQLKRHYPGRVWAVQPDVQNGVVNIFLMDVSGRWAYTLHLMHKTFEVLGRESIRAGGEILERFNLSRERHFNRDSVETLARDLRGSAIEA